jgi:hypothetical protein
MWKNVLERGRPQFTIWRKRKIRWITKTNTHSQNVIFTVFPLQQWLQEHTSLLRYMYVACLVKYLTAQSTTVQYHTFCVASVTSTSRILVVTTVSLLWKSSFLNTEYSLWHSRNYAPCLLPNVPLLHSCQPAIGLYLESYESITLFFTLLL